MSLPSAPRLLAYLYTCQASHWQPQPPPQQKGVCVPCVHPLGFSLIHSGCGLRLSSTFPFLPSLPLEGPISVSPRPFSSLLPLAQRALGLPLCCPGLFLPRARRGLGARSRALVTTSCRAAPRSPRAADWSAWGWRGSGRGREADQLFPELHNNKRTRTGWRPLGKRPELRSRARRSYLSARRSARLT